MINIIHFTKQLSPILSIRKEILTSLNTAQAQIKYLIQINMLTLLVSIIVFKRK
jgi:hypothetical protein